MISVWDQVGVAARDGEPSTKLHQQLKIAFLLDHEAHVNCDTIYNFEEMPRNEFDLFTDYLSMLGCDALREIILEGRNLSESYSIPEHVRNDPDPLAADMEPRVWKPADQRRYFEIGQIVVASLQHLLREIAWHFDREPALYAAYQNRREQDDAGKPDPAAS